MDYEKKYKEALERMKSWAKGEHPECFSEAHKAAEFIFPELKESEEEKTRNEIIAFVEQSIHRGGGTPIPKEQEDRWIAWLEKQSDDVKCLKDQIEPLEAALKAKKEVRRIELEKQGEQSQGMCSIKEKAHQIAWEISKIYDPTLSKESWCEMAALDMAFWLEKQGNQKPAEWSEENKELIDDIISVFRYWIGIGCQDSERYSYLVERLKSLRPQNHWKPSDEQIMYLYEATEIAEKAEKFSIVTAMKDIIEQLKKLKD